MNEFGADLASWDPDKRRRGRVGAARSEGVPSPGMPAGRAEPLRVTERWGPRHCRRPVCPYCELQVMFVFEMAHGDFCGECFRKYPYPPAEPEPPGQARIEF